MKSRNEIKNILLQPPRRDIIKINFDTSYNQNHYSSVSSIVTRNKDGLVMASCTYPWENITDPTTAKAKACLQAITMAKEMGFREICVEGDALTVIRKLTQEKQIRWRMKW